MEVEALRLELNSWRERCEQAASIGKQLVVNNAALQSENAALKRQVEQLRVTEDTLKNDESSKRSAELQAVRSLPSSSSSSPFHSRTVRSVFVRFKTNLPMQSSSISASPRSWSNKSRVALGTRLQEAPVAVMTVLVHLEYKREI